MSSLSFFNKKKDLNLWPITLLRVYTGAFFVYHGFGKITRGGFEDGLVGFIGSQQNTYGFFRPFLETVVVPNKALFGFMVSWGELAIGLALIVGLMTRYASLAGAIMLASFWFAKGQPPLAGQNHDFIWVMIFIVLAAVHAGRQHGLDEKLGDRFKFLR